MQRVCGNCFKHVQDPSRDLIETVPDKYRICAACARELNMCEVCGSITTPGTSKDAQLHYEDECFK